MPIQYVNPHTCIFCLFRKLLYEYLGRQPILVRKLPKWPLVKAPEPGAGGDRLPNLCDNLPKKQRSSR